CGASGDCQGTTAGSSCIDGQVCSSGRCALSCQADLVNCDGTCINPQSDRNYCGASGDCHGTNPGSTCLDGKVCASGRCALSCQAGLVNCDGTFIHPHGLPIYCGASGDCQGTNAGSTCIDGQVCSSGRCAPSCQAGLVNCNGTCINPQSDR